MTEWKKQRCASNRASMGEDFHLKVAQRRLQESANQSDALQAIREIVANLLGSEEIAIFEVRPEEAILTLFWSFGLDASRHGTLDTLRSPILQRVIQGEPYLRGAFEGGHCAEPTSGFIAFVPIRFARQTVAVLAIRSLLPQKTCFDESDVRLVQLLSGEAGNALFGERNASNA
jgi:hypothetical protein